MYSGVFKVLVPVLVVGMIVQDHPHLAHSQCAGPMMVGPGAEVMSVTASASTLLM
jgi:hypothetical protein